MKHFEGQKPLPWETAMPCLSRTELYKATAVAILALAISCLPYALGYGFAPSGWDFSGFIINAEDSYIYLAAMQQGAQGAWRFRLLYTPEDHPGAFLYLFYLLLGHLSTLTGLPLILTYHLARLVCGLALLMVAYFFIAFFIRQRAVRWIAYLLVCFSSGLGWLVLLISPTPPGGISPIDFWLMDAYTFFSVLLFPHFSLAMVSLLVVFMATLLYFRTEQVRCLMWAGVALWVLFLINPKILPVVAAALVGHWLLLLGLRRTLPWREIRGLVVLGLSLIPWLVYYGYVLLSDPVFGLLIKQDITLSPPPLYYALGYGLVFLLAIGGAIHVARQRREREFFLLAWPLAAILTLYLPFQTQRRMVTGLHIPLCTLASLGLFKYVLPTVYHSRVSRAISRALSYDRRRLRLFILNLIVVATFPSNLYLLASSSLAALQGYPALFHTEAENQAIDWLAENSQPTDTILCSYWVGNYIPARIGHRVFWGHWNLTIDFVSKRRLAEAFFQSQTDDATRRELLQTYDIAYLFYGPQERALGDFNPEDKPYLMKTFSNSKVSIYRSTD